MNGDGTECVDGNVDVNECTDGTDDCDDLATCTNTDGGFTCQCPTGYDDANGDGTDCVDVNECTDGTDDCDDLATCTNTDGGFTCQCPTDYTDVHGDGTVCDPPACTAEGDSHVVPGALPCCTGLVDVGCDAPDSGGTSCVDCTGASYCTDCGDGICGLGENECRCPFDCLVTNCTAEGDSHGIYPGALPCCAGLANVGCNVLGTNGQCTACAGASYCTDCGDGVCGLGENECRCPADCP